jgi:hypothetical protein
MSVPISEHLSALPDDVLRAVADFMPLSGLLVLARCSRKMQSVLRRQLNRHLDDLFVVRRYVRSYLCDKIGKHCVDYTIPGDTLQRQMFALFGEPDEAIGSHNFFEASQDYDEPFCVPKCIMYPVCGFRILADEGDRVPCFVTSYSHFRLRRFVGWLSRRYRKLLTAGTSQ